jgi:dolichol-phosphate mannosyltransferase
MISIVIPIHNEAENLEQLATRLTAAGTGWGEDFEVILVDDGSTDASPSMMQDIANRDSHFRIVTLSRNFGHQAAISAGLKYTRGDAVAIMDGDLQDPPEELGGFLDKWRKGYDVAYGIRTKRKEGMLKRLSYNLYYRCLQLVSEIEIPLDAGDFCVMDRRVRDALVNEMPEQNRFVRGLRAYAGFKQIGIPYERQSRAAGRPKYTLSKMMRVAIDGLIDFSRLPLRLATYFGFAVAIPSFLIGMFFIIHRIFGFEVFGHSASDTPGLASLAVGLFFLGGVNLIIMGIIGEYIGRIYYEVKRRPFFLVNSVYSQDEKTQSRAKPTSEAKIPAAAQSDGE